MGSEIPGKKPGPLVGLTVVEMGSLIAGPFCGQILGDFGATVIKIEDPKAGDPMRQWGRSLPKGLSPWWPVIGRNKLSVTLNLREPEGQDIARKLIGGADVLVENFRPGAMEKWGLGYEALSKLNPGLVMARGAPDFFRTSAALSSAAEVGVSPSATSLFSASPVAVAFGGPSGIRVEPGEQPSEPLTADGYWISPSCWFGPTAETTLRTALRAAASLESSPGPSLRPTGSSIDPDVSSTTITGR